MEKKFLYLDDIRVPKTSFIKWDIVRDFKSFREYILKNGIPDLISFDHDLADDHYHIPFEEWEVQPQRADMEETGFDCAKWLVSYCIEQQIGLPEYIIHSANPIGAENIKTYFESFTKGFPFLK